MINSLRPGYKFNQYQLLEQIGAGGQAVVWSAEDFQRKDIVAIKFNEVAEEGQELIDDTVMAQQLEKLVTLRHPRILSIYDFGLIDHVRYLVSPYIAGGSLYEKIKAAPLQFTDTLRYISEIASALAFLHQNQIIHRDLKPANVLLDLGQHSYLSDFGLARSVSNTTQAMHTGRGTPPYAPPEQHKQLAITVKSDIFSFGVILYELFTGQLPWNGDKMLGMQQLYAQVEIPDPCEINPELPPLLKEVLRRVTSADPAVRPSSVEDVIKMVDYVFNKDGFFIPDLKTMSQEGDKQDVPILLDQKLKEWNSQKKQVLVDPSKFAMIHLYQKRRNDPSVAGPLAQFMLYHSLMYGYHSDYWWMKTSDPRDRASVSLTLLEGKNEIVVMRVLDYFFKNQDVLLLLRSKASILSPLFFDLASKTRNAAFASQLFSRLQMIVPNGTTWNDSVLESEQAVLLGKAALQDSDMGDRAVNLIGHLRSRTAVEYVINNAHRDRLSAVLLEIQNATGKLPPFVSGRVRAQVFFEWINKQLTTQPAHLAAGYGLALLGSTLGIASHVYLAYRFPEYLDTLRIQTSIQQGLIAGFVFSLGIFLSRLIVERFEATSFLLRFGLASIVGTVGTSLALLLYHVLFLTTPEGLLIPAGCFIIALSFSLGKIIPWRVVKILVSTVAVFAAIVSTWWVHTAFSVSITDLTPLFQYENTWTLIQVSLAAFLVSIFIGVFGNLPSLKIHEE